MRPKPDTTNSTTGALNVAWNHGTPSKRHP